jgi:secreted protein with Ig-like and vWFA domain
MASTALLLFVQSLPYGCKFNICSYGSDHSFMFKNSVLYDDNSLEYATKEIMTFQADYGGTEIYLPLETIFKNATPKTQVHVYLLTDGAVSNNDAIIKLVKQNCRADNQIRLHTFGIGSGADERLIKGCAFAGMGNFSFINHDSEIERKVIESLSKTQLEYLLVTEAQILDENDEVIESRLDLPAPIQPGIPFLF